MDVLQDRRRPATNPSHIYVKANGSDANKEEENGLFWEDRSLDEQEEEESVATTTSTTTTSEGASSLEDFVQDILVRQHGVSIVLDTIEWPFEGLSRIWYFRGDDGYGQGSDRSNLSDLSNLARH